MGNTISPPDSKNEDYKHVMNGALRVVLVKFLQLSFSRLLSNGYHILFRFALSSLSLSLMEFHTLLSSTFFLLFLFTIAGKTVCANEEAQKVSGGYRPLKLFAFGDSYADTGNNPKSLSSSWKNPYGVTFPGKPAGRYSDGRVLTDYIARFMGIKSPLPYELRKYGQHRLQHGLNFAYGGTGVFDTGNLQPNLSTQIGYFERVVKESVYTKRDLQSSLALVAVSGNDYAAFTASGGTDQGLPSFISHVINQMGINLKRIRSLGVRRVLVTTLQPIGCLPRQTAFSSYQQCNETDNSAVIFHNQLLQKVVTSLNNSTKGSNFLILDLFNSFNAVLKNKGEFTGSAKFDTPLKPCCLATRSDAFCGTLDDKGRRLYTVCNKPESMFFWDSVHPTEAGWRSVYLTLRSSLNRIYN
ncbi:hypothetical protein QVD17_11761 [Tagetes erecta]|uniref:GDSL esterase/lipase At5g03610-like n=1 Tax=Tagetes erecta TaxID=13708 RepID=A0AAD8L1C7_TARER|nr:hypothetical protein QVD17_11761 [Tagetes erecta]